LAHDAQHVRRQAPVPPEVGELPVIGSGAARYVTVLRHGRASRPFAAAVVGRLPISMGPLGLLLLVRSEQGTYAFAGVVTGAFAVGTAVGGPWWGAQIDRLGQTRVMFATSVSSATMLAAAALLAVGHRPPGLLVGAAALAGASFPPLSAAMRATWISALPDPDLRPVAFALDAVAVESIFVLGPLLLSLLLVLTAPAVPLLVTAALLGGGGAAYSLTGAVREQHARQAPRPVGGQTRPSAASVLRTGGVPAVLAVTTAVSFGFGQVDTSLAATARQVLHDPGRVGVLFTAIAGGSVVGGLVYGARRPSAREHLRLPVVLAGFAVGLVPLAVLMALGRPAFWVLLLLLFLCGLSIAPSLIITQNLMDHLTSVGQLGEAQAWLATAGTTGSAAGTAVSGLLIDRLGIGWAFTAASAAVTVASAVSAVSRGRWTLDRHRRAVADATA